MKLEIVADASRYASLESTYQQSLVVPLDDMYASFADRAAHHVLLVDGDVAGRCAVDDNCELQHFFVASEHAGLADVLFSEAVNRLGVRTAVACTADVGVLAVGLTAATASEVIALMYRLAAPPTTSPQATLVPVASADQEAAIVFMRDQLQQEETFLRWYAVERIQKGELFLVEHEGQLAGIAEYRHDPRAPGHAHLGLIVDPAQRGRGVGESIMVALVALCDQTGVVPLCSTELTNTAARHVIRRAGFRPDHRVFRFSL